MLEQNELAPWPVLSRWIGGRYKDWSILSVEAQSGRLMCKAEEVQVISIAKRTLHVLVWAMWNRLGSWHPLTVLEKESDTDFVRYRYFSLIISTKFNNTKILKFVKIKLKILKAFDQNLLKPELKPSCLIFQYCSGTKCSLNQCNSI